MGFTTNEGMVRVDFFEPSGKWHATKEMYWDGFYSVVYDKNEAAELMHATFSRCLEKSCGDCFRDMIAVCLEPYQERTYPIMIKRWENK